MTNFIKRYFELFDSDDRQQLLESYFDQAKFSFSINKDSRSKQRAFDNNLMRDSRNLLIVKDDDIRAKLLRQGKAQVITALSNLPKTQHILESFKIDVPPIDESNYLLIIINGLYKTKQRPFNLKAFSRNFLIVSHNNTFAIANDLFTVTNPTVENINYVKNLYKNDPNSQDINFMDSMDEMGLNENNNTINGLITDSNLNNQRTNFNNNQANLLNNNFVNPVMQPVINQPLASSSLISPVVNQPIQGSPSVDQLVQRFSQITGMNLEYSARCLSDYENDPEKALEVFKQLNEKGVIPADAFQR